MKWEHCRQSKGEHQFLKHAMLRWKASNIVNPHSKPPLSPDPSPETSPTTSHWDSDDDTVMSGEECIQIRPKSINSSREGGSPTSTPLLAEVLNNTSPPPYTLSAFTAFLSQNHCLETLEFVMAARKYQEKYDSIIPVWSGMGSPTYDVPEVRELQKDWKRIIEMFLSPGSLREINLPSEERDELLGFPSAVRPPPPEVLGPAVKRMRDLMQESIWMPFLHQCAPRTPVVTFETSPGTTYRDDPMDFEKHHSTHTSRKGHSPTSSADFNRSPNLGRPLSTLTTALTKSSTGSQHKITQQVSHTSVGSSIRDCPLDDSVPGYNDSDLMTPPTTPPSSEMGLGIQHASPKGRSDSGAWKRMGAKLHWPRKKSVVMLRPPQEEE